jgi:hypothetical protein
MSCSQNTITHGRQLEQIIGSTAYTNSTLVPARYAPFLFTAHSVTPVRRAYTW